MALTEEQEQGVVIVGGGLAAQRCAETLRRVGYEGRIRIVCGEPRAPYDRPPLSKDLLADPAAAQRVAFRPLRGASPMTMLVATLGLLPAALSHGIGSDSQRPFAIVIVGGLISDLILGIFLLPTLYVWFGSAGDKLPEPEPEETV